MVYNSMISGYTRCARSLSNFIEDGIGFPTINVSSASDQASRKVAASTDLISEQTFPTVRQLCCHEELKINKVFLRTFFKETNMYI
jgi:hypothetical protein